MEEVIRKGKKGEVYREEDRENKGNKEMVGSGGVGGDGSRSKEAVGMLALHEALRNLCLNSDWTYSVFWTIRPRPYPPSPSFLSLFHFTNSSPPSSLAGGAGAAMAARLATTMAICELRS